ncbi:MAG: AAA family ATPase [Nannocystis sp.]|nr:AAA family ATPase [Nannocystis sp.]MBA3548585.1 AAA family ATPase [Nannocystis sp.]
MDRITKITIKNVRAIRYAEVDISPVTVLIGENGAGKSTIIECLEILHKAAEPSFFQNFYTIHRGLPGLLRKGATAMALGVVIEDDTGLEPRIDYSFALARQGAGAAVQSEHLLLGPDDRERAPVVALRRVGARGEILDDKVGTLVPLPPGAMGSDQLVIASFGALPPQKAIERLLGVLGGIEVHLGFDTIAAWAARSYQFTLSMRGSSFLQPAERLNLLGFNFANAWISLRNQSSSHWEETMALVRLGLGDIIDTVNVDPDAGGGNIAVSIRFVGLAEPIPAANLSDGQLSWLAFVAMARLDRGRSLLAVDEPELHLHPSLCGRVIALLMGLEGGAPVIISTHADRVLELLDDPASAVRVCVNEGGNASVQRLDPVELAEWTKDYGDLGKLRANGLLARVLKEPPADPAMETP